MASTPARRSRKPSVQPEKRQTRFNALLVIAIIVVLCYAAFLTYIRHDNNSDSARRPTQNAPQPQSAVAPKYDFYPNHTAPPQAAIPATTPPRPPIELLSTVGRSSTAAAQASTTKNGGFVIQAGAFNQYRDAETRTAALLLIGIKSYIEAGQVGNSEVHRVRIGPFAKRADAAKLRKRLDDEKIPAYVLSVN